jgi:hypothetical protein
VNIFYLYQGKNKLHFNEMMMMPALITPSEELLLRLADDEMMMMPALITPSEELLLRLADQCTAIFT